MKALDLPRLGTVEHLPQEREDHPRQRQLQAIAECARCGKRVELWAETEGWVLEDDGRWVHDDYGPPEGICCGLLYVIQPDGTEEAYELEPRP